MLTAPRSPWQNPYVERLIGSIRRECLDHVIVLNERSLRRILRSYVGYYHHLRTHLALGKDAPVSRAVEPAEPADVVAIPHVGGLHHSYHTPHCERVNAPLCKATRASHSVSRPVHPRGARGSFRPGPSCWSSFHQRAIAAPVGAEDPTRVDDHPREVQGRHPRAGAGAGPAVAPSARS